MAGKLLLIYICNFHVLSHLLLIYMCKLHWNRRFITEAELEAFMTDVVKQTPYLRGIQETALPFYVLTVCAQADPSP